MRGIGCGRSLVLALLLITELWAQGALSAQQKAGCEPVAPRNPRRLCGSKVFFPGSVPLYKSGELVGGLGISGDGVEQAIM